MRAHRPSPSELDGCRFVADDSLFVENPTLELGKWPWAESSRAEPFEDERREAWEALYAIRTEAMWRAVHLRRRPRRSYDPRSGYLRWMVPPNTLPWWNGRNYPPTDFGMLAELDLDARETASVLIYAGCGV